ncbi:MAG: lysophospholipid acyltransferase family protein [FCB group bacterium]|nr:lysophospholipid acyltransferase family protein [FCB group bacterium]
MKTIHGIEYLVVRFLAFLFRLFPRKASIKLGERLGRAVGNLWTSRHNIVIDNLKIAYSDELSSAKREELSRDVFGNIGKTMAEVCRFSITSRQQILDMVTVEGENSLKEALEYGKGAILLGSHFGNWELVGAFIHALGYPIDYMIRGQHNRYVDDYLTSLRAHCGVNVIHSERGMIDVLRALKSNHQVAIVADQHAGSHGVQIEFFGRLVSVPRAPATLSVRTGAPIMIGHMYRQDDGSHHAVFDPLIYPNREADVDEEIVRLTRQFTVRFEQAIRERPDHWLWTHRRFKTLSDTKQSGDRGVK